MAAVNISCTNLTVDGEPISEYVQNIDEATVGSTTFTGDLKATTLQGQRLEVIADATVGGDIFAEGLHSNTLVCQDQVLSTTMTITGDAIVGRIGVGGVTPTEALTVEGSVLASGTIGCNGDLGCLGYLSVGNGAVLTGNLLVDSSSSACNLLVDATNNRVGILNLTPGEALDVTGNIRTSGAILTTQATARTAGQVGYIYSVPNNTALGTITINAVNTFLVATMTINQVGVYLYTGKVALGMSSSTSVSITRLQASITDTAGTTTYASNGTGPHTLVITTNANASQMVTHVETVTSVPWVRKLYMLYTPGATNLNSISGTAYFNAVKIA